MSGHNKWSKIKRKKEVTDAKKSKVFSKYAKLIAVESKNAGGDTSSPGLRAVIEKAKAENMPNDNIDRAVKKGTGNDMTRMNPVLYEAYGPGGCAILIEGLTDNKNRTSAEVKHILSKNGFALASAGAAAWIFKKDDSGYTAQTTTKINEDDQTKLQKIVEELEDNDDVQDVYTNAA